MIQTKTLPNKLSLKTLWRGLNKTIKSKEREAWLKQSWLIRSINSTKMRTPPSKKCGEMCWCHLPRNSSSQCLTTRASIHNKKIMSRLSHRGLFRKIIFLSSLLRRMGGLSPYNRSMERRSSKRQGSKLHNLRRVAQFPLREWPPKFFRKLISLSKKILA